MRATRGRARLVQLQTHPPTWGDSNPISTGSGHPNPTHWHPSPQHHLWHHLLLGIKLWCPLDDPHRRALFSHSLVHGAPIPPLTGTPPPSTTCGTTYCWESNMFPHSHPCGTTYSGIQTHTYMCLGWPTTHVHGILLLGRFWVVFSSKNVCVRWGLG